MYSPSLVSVFLGFIVPFAISGLSFLVIKKKSVLNSSVFILFCASVLFSFYPLHIDYYFLRIDRLTFFCDSLSLIFLFSSMQTLNADENKKLPLILSVCLMTVFRLNDLLPVFLFESLFLFTAYLYLRNNSFGKKESFRFLILSFILSSLIFFGTSMLFTQSLSTNFRTISINLSHLNFNPDVVNLALTVIIISYTAKIFLMPYYFFLNKTSGLKTELKLFLHINLIFLISFILLRFLSTSFIDHNSFISNTNEIIVLANLNSDKICLYLGSILIFISAASSLVLKHGKHFLSMLFFWLTGILILSMSNTSLENVQTTLMILFVIILSASGVLISVNFIDAGYKNNFVKTSLIIFLVTAIGLPPSIGFFAKFYLFSSLISSTNIWAVVLLVLTMIPFIYRAFHFIKNIFLEPIKPSEIKFGIYSYFNFIVLLIPAILLSVAPGLLINFVKMVSNEMFP